MGKTCDNIKRKSMRKSIRKSMRKSMRKSRRKSMRKSRRKSMRKSKRKSMRKSRRKSMRKYLGSGDEESRSYNGVDYMTREEYEAAKLRQGRQNTLPPTFEMLKTEAEWNAHMISMRPKYPESEPEPDSQQVHTTATTPDENIIYIHSFMKAAQFYGGEKKRIFVLTNKKLYYFDPATIPAEIPFPLPAQHNTVLPATAPSVAKGSINLTDIKDVSVHPRNPASDPQANQTLNISMKDGWVSGRTFILRLEDDVSSPMLPEVSRQVLTNFKDLILGAAAAAQAQVDLDLGTPGGGAAAPPPATALTPVGARASDPTALQVVAAQPPHTTVLPKNLRKGWLYKSPDGIGFWQRRYFVLDIDGSTLTWYHNREEVDPIGSVSLKDCRMRDLIGPGYDGNASKFGITVDRRKFIFNEGDKKQGTDVKGDVDKTNMWVNAFGEVIASNVSTCKGCARKVAPGKTTRGNPYDTCCRECTRSDGTVHSDECETRFQQSDLGAAGPQGGSPLDEGTGAHGGEGGASR